MQTCPKCGAQTEDDANFCSGCGTHIQNAQTAQNNSWVPPMPVYDPYDHTSEFDAKDISENKVTSMLAYLMGAIGVIIAVLASNQSRYATFHVRQALKFTVVEILLGIIAVATLWTAVIPIAAGVMFVVLFVVKIICFFQICSGKAKEPAIIRSLDFLK